MKREEERVDKSEERDEGEEKQTLTDKTSCLVMPYQFSAMLGSNPFNFATLSKKDLLLVSSTVYLSIIIIRFNHFYFYFFISNVVPENKPNLLC